MADEHFCPRCEYEITEDEDYCEMCQWDRDMQDFLDNANDHDHSELLSDILIELFWTHGSHGLPAHYSNSHTIDSDRTDRVRRSVNLAVRRWRASKEKARA